MERELFARFRAFRARGRRLARRWLEVNAHDCLRLHEGAPSPAAASVGGAAATPTASPSVAGTAAGDSEAAQSPLAGATQPPAAFVASRRWRRNFQQRFRIVVRAKTNSKKLPLVQRLPLIAAYLSKYSAMLRRPSKRLPEKPLHAAWGRFLPRQRYNMDQIPVAFSSAKKTTYEQVGAQNVQICQGGEGDSKRSATWHLCFHPDPTQPQPKLLIIFRGQGARVSTPEKMWIEKMEKVCHNDPQPHTTCPPQGPPA